MTWVYHRAPVGTARSIADDRAVHERPIRDAFSHSCASKNFHSLYGTGDYLPPFRIPQHLSSPPTRLSTAWKCQRPLQHAAPLASRQQETWPPDRLPFEDCEPLVAPLIRQMRRPWPSCRLLRRSNATLSAVATGHYWTPVGVAKALPWTSRPTVDGAGAAPPSIAPLVPPLAHGSSDAPFRLTLLQFPCHGPSPRSHSDAAFP
jgi:hypothetical protein